MASKKSSQTTWFSIFADYASFYTALLLVAFIMVCFLDHTPLIQEDEYQAKMTKGVGYMHQPQFFKYRPCSEIYVVREGETLHTISDKCDDPFIVERNPHVHDPDDVFPGLVIKITPMMSRKMLR